MRSAKSTPAARPFGDAIVVARVPMLPVEVVRDLYAAADPRGALRVLVKRTPALDAGIRIASPSLHAEMSDWLAGRPLKKNRAVLSVLAYTLRTATRCTPYGLFASLGSVDLGNATTLRPAPAGRRRLHLEPDFGWLNAVWISRSHEPHIGDGVLLFTNDLITDRGEMLHVYRGDRATRVFGAPVPVWRYDGVCVRANPILRAIRGFCASGIPAGELAVRLADRFGADAGLARGLIGKLLDAGLIVTQRPPLTAGSFVASSASTASAEARGLTMLAADISNVESAGVDALSAHDISRIESRMATLAPGRRPSLDADVTHRFEGTLSGVVLADVALLAKLALTHASRTDMNAEIERFVERYESLDRLVPLLELVQSDFEVGVQPRERVPDPQHDRLLLALAVQAARDGRLEVELTPMLERLYPGVRDGALQQSCDIGFRISARSSAEMASGAYQIVATKLANTNGIARSARRFSNHLGQAFVDRVAEAERRAIACGDDIVAELEYVPLDDRYAHLMRRTTSHRHIIADAATPCPPRTTKISPADILIGIENGRFAAYARSLGRRLRIETSFLLDADYFAPPHMRLLSRIAHQDRATPTAWSWGAAAESLPFRPRVRAGRIVLAPATWSIPKRDLSGSVDALAATIAEWRAGWQLPRWVMLTERDLQLPLDLDAPVALELLHDQLRRYREENVTFEEFLPAFDDLWLRGEEGTYCHEFVAALVAEPPSPLPSARTIGALDLDHLGASAVSDWAYVKLYVAWSEIDALISTELLRIVQPIIERGDADAWFFLRYRDPEPHVRLRVRSTTDRGWDLIDALVTAIEPLVSVGIVRRFSFDTYLAEIERYGGADALEALEMLFFADSEAAVRELAGAAVNVPARQAAALRSLVRTLPEWFRAFDRDRWLADRAAANRRVRDIDYELVRNTRKWLAQCESGAGTLEIAALGRLADLARSGGLSRPLEDIFEGFVHMHFNRFGIAFEDEAVLVAHLWRALHRGGCVQSSAAESRESQALAHS